MLSNSIYAFGVLVFMIGSNAHMIMQSPAPYNLSSPLTTDPIGTDTGYLFPCHRKASDTSFDNSNAAPMTVGQDNLLNFVGSAVHGGGSCQLSVTYEHPPPADYSKWKVIHSYIGSCPAQAVGNLDQETPYTFPDGTSIPNGKHCGGDQGTECVRSYQFKLPQGMKNGDATLAWTWFNKIGNREMYMNCAPITISGGSDDDTYVNSLPEIFVANYPPDANACTTSQSSVIGFPNPGDSVTYGEAITSGGQGTCPAAGSSSSSNSSSSADASTSATSSAAASSSSSADSGLGVSVSIDLSQNGKTSVAAAQSTTMVTVAGAASSSVVATSASSAYVAQSYSTAASSASGNSSSGTCDEGKVSCSTPGAVVCIGSSQFGLCNTDNCAVPQDLAAGTTCSAGVITKRDVVRRSDRFHRHAAGHAHKNNF